MRKRLGAMPLIVITMAMATACGSSGSSTTPSSPSATKPPTQPLGVAVCDAYLRATKTEKHPSKQASAMLASLAKIRTDASDRAKVRALKAAFQKLEAVWTGTTPTTPSAFMDESRAASDKFSAAATDSKLDPCPRPDSTATSTTAVGPTKPAWSFNTIELPTSGDGLWMYFDAACPSGTTITGVADPWQANPGAPSSFAALVPGLAAGQSFTGTAADAAFGARPDFSGSCA